MRYQAVTKFSLTHLTCFTLIFVSVLSLESCKQKSKSTSPQTTPSQSVGASADQVIETKRVKPSDQATALEFRNIFHTLVKPKYSPEDFQKLSFLPTDSM